MTRIAETARVRRFAAAVSRLNKSELDKRIAPPKDEAYHAVYSELEKLRIKLIENDSLRADSDERTQQMIASVTHDLKTYVAVISGYAESIQDGIGKDDYPELIREKCASMNDMILKIIADARSKSADLKSRLQLISFREYVVPVLKRAIAPAREKGILVKINRIPNVRIVVSPDDFTSVVENLLSNATKFTPKGGKITIRFRTSSKYLFMKVSDSGTGISPEDADHIFERYYTADKSRAIGSGTGIGLSHAKDVMQAHGGDVIYVKTRKPGAVFLAYLPKYSRLKEALTADERKLTANVLQLIGFPFVTVFRFFYTFYLAAKVAKSNRIADKNRRFAKKADKKALASPSEQTSE